MIHVHDILNPPLTFLARSAVAERLDALRNTSPAGEHGKWIFVTVVIIVVCTLIVVPLGVYIYKRLARLINNLHISLHHVSERETKLTSADMELLTRMIRKSGFLRPDLEFTLPHALRIGMTNYLGSDDYTELPGEQRRDVAEKIELLESKLGVPQTSDEQTLTTRDILLGATIMVSGVETQDHFDVTVLANTDEGLRVQFSHSQKFSPEATWIFRYFDGVKVWGFTTPVVVQDDEHLLLRHTDELEMVNYRRFARVSVNRSAKISRFVFHCSGEAQRPLEFVHADVVEIGGPGVMIQTTLHLRAGERILILLDFGNDETIQAVGKIRRINGPDPVKQWNRYGVELIGLKPSQIAELMHATNSLAIQKRKEEQNKTNSNETANTLQIH